MKHVYPVLTHLLNSWHTGEKNMPRQKKSYEFTKMAVKHKTSIPLSEPNLPLALKGVLSPQLIFLSANFLHQLFMRMNILSVDFVSYKFLRILSSASVRVALGQATLILWNPSPAFPKILPLSSHKPALWIIRSSNSSTLRPVSLKSSHTR